MEKLLLIITQDYIDTGVKMDCHDCPIGLAMKEFQFNHFAVGNDYILIWETEDSRMAKWEMPEDMIKWVAAFDHGDQVFPAAFFLTKKEQY